MAEDKSKIDEDVDVGPIHALMAMPEPERSQYCIDVVNALANALEEITKVKAKIKQAKMIKLFFADLRNKKDEVLPVMFYIIKPQFRDTVQDLMERFSGYAEKEMK
jgi:hypothetical protein